jgi:hypothetical protein
MQAMPPPKRDAEKGMLFEEIVAKIFPNLMKSINQEAQRTLSTKNTKETVRRTSEPNCSKTIMTSQDLVAHACNPSYSGSRDQEDFGLNPAQANSS